MSDNLARRDNNAVSRPTYRSATSRLAEPFPTDTEDVFVALEQLASQPEGSSGGNLPPSGDNILWAKRVLLHVLPRAFLRGADIVPFQGEIHVTWEKDDKKVVVFLPKPDQLKIYYERLENGIAVDHKLIPTSDPSQICPVLQWLFR